MIKRIVNTEDNTMSIKELEKYVGNNYPVAIRSALEVSRPYEVARYKIVRGVSTFHLINLDILSVVYSSNVICTDEVGCEIIDFIKELISKDYIVKIHTDDLNQDEED